ncbi:MAG: hypothetical protein QMC40_06825 [Vicingaceae bacterium]
MQETPDVQHLYLFSQEIGEKWHSNEEPWRFQMAGVEFLYKEITRWFLTNENKNGRNLKSRRFIS